MQTILVATDVDDGMQFDWMVQCYPGAGEHRDSPLLESLDRSTVLDAVDLASDIGIEGFWAPDHFMLGPRGEEYELWTLLGFLAERTDTADIGSLVGSITYRNPALLAKMATTVDILSEGRLQLGLGAGWYEEEHTAYGYEFPDVGTRIDMLEEGLQVVTEMFTAEDPQFSGEHFQIDGALNNPKPVQDPHPPIVVGGGGPRMLRLAAKYADEWNVEISARATGPPLEYKVEKFDEYLQNNDRDPDDVTRSWLGHVLVTEDESTLEEQSERIFPLPWGESADMEGTQLTTPEEARERGDFLVGTPNQVAAQIEGIRDLGFTKLQLLFLDFPSTDGMELFGDEVLPQFT